MGKLLMIQTEDDNKIKKLKERLGLKNKVEVVRSALLLLEENLSRQKRIEKWKKAAKIVGKQGMDVFNDFKTTGRFKKLR